MRHLLFIVLLLPLLSCSGNNSEAAQNSQPEKTVTTTPGTAENVVAPVVSNPVEDSAFLIVPGISIGQISIGQTSEDVYNAIGKPDSGDAAMGKAMSFWTGKGKEKQNFLAVYFSRNYDGGPDPLFARQIRVNSPAFKTQKGIHSGSSLASIREHYNVHPMGYYINPKQQRTYLYDDTAKGIVFEIATPDSVCTAITIHYRGETILNSYLPVYPDLVWLNG